MNLPECTYEFGLTRRDGTGRFYFLNNNSFNGSLGSYQSGTNQFYVAKGANGVFSQLPWGNRVLVDTTVRLTSVFSNGTRTVYWDGRAIGTYSREENNSEEIALLFGSCYKYYDFTTCADIYFSRVYAKALTSEEVSYNYMIDKIRFGL